MKRYRQRGAITVFLSLISVLFLSLLCTAVESARVQGCRAKAAAALDMGLFSVMGEFERGLLEKYDVFFLDGAAGAGSYSTGRISDVLNGYMAYNADPNRGQLVRRFDPFGLRVEDARVTGVGLATDDKGEAFYQQAVRFMRGNLASEVISIWTERMQEGRKLEDAGETYKNQDASIADKLKTMEEQQKQLEEQQKQEQQGQEQGEAPQTEEPQKPQSNPLDIIRKIQKEGILSLVLRDKGTVSQKELPSDSPSRRRCRKGSLPVEETYGGLIDNFIFQQYLFERFALFTDAEKEGVLDYALEYILCGKNTDEKNLTSVVNRLLLLREGANFLYLSQDEPSMAAAQGLAAALAGWIPIPGVTTVVAYALLLAWAYGESLLDVRELLAGGKVPVLKDAGTWRLGLSSLVDLLLELKHADGSRTEGLCYADYLQILFTLGNQKKYPMRALDLIEGFLRSRPETASFRMDNAIFRIAAEADFYIPPLFLKVSNAFLKTGTASVDYHVSGGFAY